MLLGIITSHLNFYDLIFFKYMVNPLVVMTEGWFCEFVKSIPSQLFKMRMNLYDLISAF